MHVWSENTCLVMQHNTCVLLVYSTLCTAIFLVHSSLALVHAMFKSGIDSTCSSGKACHASVNCARLNMVLSEQRIKQYEPHTDLGRLWRAILTTLALHNTTQRCYRALTR
jgi:hypothetical protein